MAGLVTVGIVACNSGDDPSTLPVYTAGTTGSMGGSSSPTGHYTGAGGTGTSTGAAGSTSTGAAGHVGGTGEAGTTGAAGGGGSGAGGTTGAAGAAGGSSGQGEAGRTGAAGTGAAGMASGGTTGAAGMMTGAAGTTGTAGMMMGAAGTTGAAGMMGAAGTGGSSMKAAVQAILNANCVVCHGAAGGQSLSDVSAVVGVASSECAPKVRVAAGSPTTSYLVDKLMGASQTAGGCFSGMRMPRGRPALSAANITTIVNWIKAGAN
jgi:pilus assembly protein FimV